MASRAEVLVWRLSSRRHRRAAFTGEGARRYGGRWNLPGTALVYTARSLSLAVLETLVNVDTEDLPTDLVALSADIPRGVRIRRLEARDLPRSWRRYPAPQRLQEIGTAWAREAKTPFLSVPSAVIPAERLFLLNPSHPLFKGFDVRKDEPFRSDRRLAT